ncbi:HNH endonuclease [Enterococcus faecium]
MPRVRRCRQQGCHTMVAYPNYYCAIHFEHEAEYLANRQRWARSRDKGYQQRYNRTVRNRTQQKTEQYNFYRTREWSQLRNLALERDHYLCQYCKVQGIITPAKIVDHIVPIEYAPQLSSELENLADICGACHRLKTDWEQKYYGAGKDNELKRVAMIKNIGKIVQLMTK